MSTILVELRNGSIGHNFEVQYNDIVYIGNGTIQFTVNGIVFQANLVNKQFRANADAHRITNCQSIEYRERVKATRAFKNIDVFTVSTDPLKVADQFYYIDKIDDHFYLIDKNDYDWIITPIKYSIYDRKPRYGLLLYFSGSEYFLNDVEVPITNAPSLSVSERTWFIAPHSFTQRKQINFDSLFVYVHKLITDNYTDGIFEEIEQQLAMIRPKRNLPVCVKFRYEYKNAEFKHNFPQQ